MANKGKGGGMTSEQATQWLWSSADAVAGEVIAAYTRNIHRRLYLRYRRGLIGFIAEDQDNSIPWELWNEAIPRHLDRRQLTRWIVDRLKSCPCLPAAEA
jgi:hypothetical protein